MKRLATLISAALGIALATGTIMGCANQTAQLSQDTLDSSSSAVEQTQEEILAELRNAVKNVPKQTSVTVTEEESSTYNGGESSSEETISSKTVYKFDSSGDQLRTSAEAKISDVEFKYYTEGDKAVFVSDGPVYSGTTEQFDLVFANGLQAYLEDSIGKLDVLIDCAKSVEKMQSNGLTFYTLMLDPKKYIESDEALGMLAEYGTLVKEAVITIGFEEDGNICSIDKKDAYEDSTAVTGLVFSDYNSTVIDPMPKATKTFEEMEADSQAKLDAFEKELESSEN